MTRIRVLQSIASPSEEWRAGEVYDVPKDQARAWCDGVRAELVETTEAAAAPENTARRVGRPRARG